MAEVFFYGLIVAIPTALIGGLLLTNSRIIKQMQIIVIYKIKLVFLKLITNLWVQTFAIVLMLLPVLLITIPNIILGVTNLPEIN